MRSWAQFLIRWWCNAWCKCFLHADRKADKIAWPLTNKEFTVTKLLTEEILQCGESDISTKLLSRLPATCKFCLKTGPSKPACSLGKETICSKGRKRICFQRLCEALFPCNHLDTTKVSTIAQLYNISITDFHNDTNTNLVQEVSEQCQEAISIYKASSLCTEDV